MMSIAVPGAAARAWLSGCSRQSESRAPRGSRDKQRCPSLSSVPKCLESTEPLESIGKHWKTLENIGKRWKTVENSGKQWKSWKQMEKQMEKTWAGASGCKRCRGLHILRDPFGNVDSCVVTANKEFTTLNEERQ